MQRYKEQQRIHVETVYSCMDYTFSSLVIWQKIYAFVFSLYNQVICYIASGHYVCEFHGINGILSVINIFTSRIGSTCIYKRDW
jgi:hypothetical protein